ncbi:DUF2911 domain-containing protein [Parachryseolinea silvisoli]|jgi:hypothetical protein|uniref:DUF2911 domain-containing protein n=1 Tax=Parachryseolinea silvisoli TaxID=2873601 RepID=UPI002265C917|nr:DUF2911 domain-containing protein [Parachryseolinea silvisoli]MCD9016312.1 DUF2911 domain-containing protein [Parachryseolinea silvisoli]
MKKFLIISGLAVAVLIILGWATMYYMKKQTKSFSPEEEVVFSQNKLTINVFYNRPFKKGRVIYGGLVPYGKVWRTGANEATTFQTSQDLKFEGKTLRKGRYSLWTIPGEDTWTIIFNSEYGQWGVSSDGEANRSPDRDVLQVQVHPVLQDREFEQFTIAFEKLGEEVEMVLMWDKTLVAVPFAY